MEIAIYKEPEKLLQKLICFDTSNPPGYEKDCVMYIKSILDDAGIETRIYALDENRPNLWARLKSENPVKPPVMMYGHVDVVPVDGQEWKLDPFAGIIEDGFVNGRGAVDMKSGVAMFICVMLKIKLEHVKLDFDLTLLLLSDEEDTGKYGSKFMVENHAELFGGISCAISEIGGFSLNIGGKRFYPIMIAEKQVSTVRITFYGQAGHGSMKYSETAMTKMARAVTALSKNRLKVHVTPEVSFMIEEISKGIKGIIGFLLKRLINPYMTNTILDVMKEDGLLFDNLLHNSINITIVHGGTAVNVVPGKVYVECDLRILPGCRIESALDDVGEVLSKKAGLNAKDYEVEIVEYDKNDGSPALKHFDMFKSTLKEMDPEGIPVPFVLGAVTDGRIFSRVGLATYGFTPMRLPEDFDFTSQAHNANEKIPVNALTFGIEAILLFLTKHYC